MQRIVMDKPFWLDNKFEKKMCSFEDFKNIMKEMEYEIIFRYDKISIKGKNYK